MLRAIYATIKKHLQTVHNLSILISIYLYSLSIHLSIYPSIYLSIHLSIHLSIYLDVRPVEKCCVPFMQLLRSIYRQYTIYLSLYLAIYILYLSISRCKACGKVLRAIYATIKKHLQTVHNLAFKEYANSYNVFKVTF